jgi:hypothetical protein
MEPENVEPFADLPLPASLQGAEFESPDWDHCPDEILCPLCEYNLRGLTDPRCPECGYKFQWPDLLDPARREHPYLFELRPKENFTSFWKTAFHGLKPGKFWKVLRADQRSNPRRLMIYWLIIAGIVLLAFAGDYLVQELDIYLFEHRRILVPSTLPVINPKWDALPLAYFVIPAVVTLGWPWLTVLSLSVFQTSMRRARVNQTHVLRCAVYSWDAFLWVGLIAIGVNSIRTAGVLLNTATARSRLLTVFEIGTPNWVWCILVALVFIYRLNVAYWRYLRFRHVIATILLSQFIVLLLVLTMLTFLAMAKVFRY